jgi:HlyD family secretion protein
VQSAAASLERANKDLSRTAILSPMNGVVSLLSVKKGERVVGNSMMAGTEIMRIADMSKIEVRVDVGENDIPKVKLGDSALIEVDAYTNRKFKGVVTQIASSSAATATATSGVSSNDVTNYKVYIRILPESYQDLIDRSRPKNFPFRPGMTASADIMTKTKQDVLTIAINAVTTREKGTDNVAGAKKDEKKEAGIQEATKTGLSTDLDEVVFVLQPDGTVKKVKVKTDVQDINYIEVTEGLKVGDQVVAAPYNIVSKTLKDGMKVQVVEKDKLFEAPKP